MIERSHPTLSVGAQPFSWAATVRERERTLHNQRDELWHMRQLSARKSSDQRALGRAACGIGVRVPRARLRPRRRFTDSVVGKTVHRTVFRSSSTLPIEPIELLVVHDHALALEQHADPAIAEPAPLSGD